MFGRSKVPSNLKTVMDTAAALVDERARIELAISRTQAVEIPAAGEIRAGLAAARSGSSGIRNFRRARRWLHVGSQSGGGRAGPH